MCKIIHVTLCQKLKTERNMNGLVISQANTKNPDMTGWSENRKANYIKTQRLLKMRWSNNNWSRY